MSSRPPRTANKSAPRAGARSALPPGERTSGAGASPPRRRWVVPVAVVAMLALVGVTVWLTSALDDSASTDPSAGGDPGIAHVHGLGVDPADGTLYAATHFGLFKIPDGGSATRVADRYQDTMGFTVVGPNHFLGSGHPDLREDKPALLGLIESVDAGNTWRDLSLSGQVDFHALEAKHDRVYGFDATGGRFMVSDNKPDWDTRAVLPMADFTVSPDDPELVLSITEQGLVRSTDGGRTFAAIDDVPALLLVSWPTTDGLYGATTSGAVLTSTDGGATWEQRGSLDGSPEALTAIDAQTVHAATDRGIFTSTDGGRSFTLRYSASQAN